MGNSFDLTAEESTPEGIHQLRKMVRTNSEPEDHLTITKDKIFRVHWKNRARRRKNLFVGTVKPPDNMRYLRYVIGCFTSEK